MRSKRVPVFSGCSRWGADCVSFSGYFALPVPVPDPFQAAGATDRFHRGKVGPGRHHHRRFHRRGFRRPMRVPVSGLGDEFRGGAGRGHRDVPRARAGFVRPDDRGPGRFRDGGGIGHDENHRADRRAAFACGLSDGISDRAALSRHAYFDAHPRRAGHHLRRRGGLFCAVHVLAVPGVYYWNNTQKFTHDKDIWIGVVKGFFLG